MGNQSSRVGTYEQYYAALKQSNPAAAKVFDPDGMGLNPYEVLNVPKNFEWNELVTAYRNIARLTHPDQGGSAKLFQLTTECFRQLAAEYKRRQADRPHHELKKDAQNYYSDRVPAKPVASMKTDENFLDRFNRTFEENRLQDDVSGGGYGHMMAASSKTREDLSVPQHLRKFNEKEFHQKFEEVTLESSKEVTVYKEPEFLPLAKRMQYTELGADKPGDYSSGEGEKRSLQYTDYMKAHTTQRIVDPRAVEKRPEYRTVEQYDAARAEIMKRPMTDEERRWMEQKTRLEEQKEQERLRRLEERDKQLSLHHDKMQRLMLGR